MSLPAAFLRDAERLIPQDRRFTDALSTLAFGTDASFYRLIPKLVVRVESEDEVVELLRLARRDNVSVTFRAAGTSLSRSAIRPWPKAMRVGLWKSKLSMRGFLTACVVGRLGCENIGRIQRSYSPAWDTPCTPKRCGAN